MTGNVTIRPSHPDDAPAIHRIRADPAVRRLQPLEQRSVEEIRQLLATREPETLDAESAGKLQWTIEVDGEVAGWVTVTVTFRSHHIGSIGYSLAPRFHGRGITTQAVREATRIAMDPNGLALERLEAVAATDNIASRRVLEKCGFAFEGIAWGYLIIANRRVDHARYARLREE